MGGISLGIAFACFYNGWVIERPKKIDWIVPLGDTTFNLLGEKGATSKDRKEIGEHLRKKERNKWWWAGTIFLLIAIGFFIDG